MFAKWYTRKLYRLPVVFLLLVFIVTACSPGNKNSGNNPPQTNQPTGVTAVAGKYPIVDKPLTLTMWRALSKASAVIKDFNEMAAFQEAEKATGIHIEFKHPPAGQEKDQFNLMVASNDMPDIVWAGYFKSDGDALANKLIIPLNELVDKYAPNYKKVLEGYPNLRKSMYTDEGKLTGLAYAQPYLENVLTEGYMIRKDWLDKLGLAVPETIDDWEKVLTAFKEKDPNGNGKPDEIPFDAAKGKAFYGFGYAWGIKPYDYYLDGGLEKGKVKYGPIEPAFREYITKMNDWYKKGLINRDYLTSDDKMRDANMTSSRTGAFFGAMSGALGNYTGLMSKDPSFLLWPAPWAKLNSSSKIYVDYGRALSLNGGRGYITAANKYPVETMRWFDWGYTKEGQLAFNFGKEGLTYAMKDGNPIYTDEIMKNPKGLSTNNAIAKYCLANMEGGFVQHPSYIEQIVGSTPAQRQALRVWGKGWTDSSDQNLGTPSFSLTDAEQASDSGRSTDIKTYTDEMIDKFIIGQEPIANYDRFVAQLKTMGINESLKLRQDAFERWKKRGDIPFSAKIDSAKLSYKNATLITDKGLQFLDPDLK